MSASLANVDLFKKAYPWIALTLLVVVVFVVKFSVLGEYPPSDDMGGHLAILKSYFHGLDIRPERMLHHPPLYYILVLEPLTFFFPTFFALNIAAALISTIIVIPMFFLVRETTGSNEAAIIASFLFTFSELYSEMMGWGGIPNLLGIFFMLFSICYFIKSIGHDSWKNIVLAAVLFSFAIGTHHLAAVYYAIVLLASVPLLVALKTAKLRSIGRTSLLLMAITIPLSLPYLHVYTFLLPQRVNVATGFLPSTELYYSALLNSFSIVTREWPAIFALNAIVLASVLNLWSRHKAKTVTGIVSSSVIAVVVLVFMLHPSLMPRAFYFIHVPIFFAFGVLLSDVFARLRSGKVLQKVLFYALLAVVAWSLTSAAYSRMIVAKNFYQSLDDETVEALDWLKHYTPSDAVILTNYGKLPGWIEGYSERKTISRRSLDILIYSLEYQESIIANKILSGNQILMSPYLLVSDDFPTNSRNPQIALKAREWYEELIFFQDVWQTLSFSQNSSTLSTPEKTVENVTQTNGSAGITYKYSCDQATLFRRVEVACDPQTDIFYDLRLANASGSKFEIPVCVNRKSKVDNYLVNNGEVVLNLMTPYGEVCVVRVSVVETNSRSVNVTFATYPIKEQPTFVFALNPEGSELFAHFRVLFDLEIGSTDCVEYLMAQELLEIYNITHVLLDKRRVLDSYRFTCETDKYEVVFENDTVLIVKVEKQRFESEA